MTDDVVVDLQQYSSKSHTLFLHGYLYQPGENEYVIKSELTLTKFTIAFWYKKSGTFVKIRDNNVQIIYLNSGSSGLRYDHGFGNIIIFNSCMMFALSSRNQKEWRIQM